MKQKKLIVLLIGILLIWLIIVRSFAYIYGDLPLGYDPGFYKSFFDAYFAATPNFDYWTISPWIAKMYEPFLWFSTTIFQFLGYSTEFLLKYGLLFFSIVTSGFIYIVLKKYDKRYGIIGAILFLASIVQYQAFWRCYYKQIIGILFILTAIYLIHKEKYRLSILPIVWACTIQRPTGLFLVATIWLYIIGKYIYTRKVSKDFLLSLCLAWVLSIALYLPLFESLILPMIKPLIKTALISWKSWTFFKTSEYLWYARPYLLLASIAIWIRIKKKMFDMLDAWFIFGIIRVSLRLYFYNRMIVFLDLFSILLAAWVLWYSLQKKIWYYVLAIFVVAQSIRYTSYVKKHYTPLAWSDEIKFLSSLKYALPKNSLLIATSSNYSPWVNGYSGFPTMAPWLFELDPRTKAMWIQRRKGDWAFKCKRFRETKKMQKENVFMFIGRNQNQENIKGWDCFKLIARGPGFYLFWLDIK